MIGGQAIHLMDPLALRRRITPVLPLSNILNFLYISIILSNFSHFFMFQESSGLG
jgi:hypothetical protein